MTIDKAIELLMNKISGGKPIVRADLQDAINLGIEALKEIKAARSYSVGLIPEKLPGETGI